MKMQPKKVLICKLLLDNPMLESMSAERFAGVNATYGPVVVSAISLTDDQ